MKQSIGTYSPYTKPYNTTYRSHQYAAAAAAAEPAGPVVMLRNLIMSITKEQVSINKLDDMYIYIAVYNSVVMTIDLHVQYTLRQ